MWLGIAIVSWGALFSIAKRTLPVLDPFFLGSARYAVGVLLFIAILWITEGRQAFRYGGRFLPAAVYGLFGFTAFNTFVWCGLAYTRPEHASIIMALQTPMIALAVWLTRGLRPAPFTVGCIAVAIGGVLLVVTKGDLAHAFEGGSLLATQFSTVTSRSSGCSPCCVFPFIIGARNCMCRSTGLLRLWAS